MVLADITIDLSTAEQDPATGQFCVVQKVKKKNRMLFFLYDDVKTLEKMKTHPVEQSYFLE